jgi:hypothetical protein
VSELSWGHPFDSPEDRTERAAHKVATAARQFLALATPRHRDELVETLDRYEATAAELHEARRARTREARHR